MEAAEKGEENFILQSLTRRRVLHSLFTLRIKQMIHTIGNKSLITLLFPRT